MSDTVQLIKDRLDVVEFLKQYLPLNPAGKNFKGNCPFHKEKTPSFIVSPDRQIWHCFGCSAGGDVIGFVMRYENVEFVEALKILAEKAGVDMKIGGGLDQRQYALLYEINNAAKDLFKANLKAATPVSELARDYLRERGLKQETIEEFELGLAPNASDALSQRLLKAGYKMADIEKAGLVFKTERGTYWDRFRHRIMFPIHNHFGKVVGFTGRLMPGSAETEAGKYVNSPETPIFNKSKLLFGFDKSKNFIREAKNAVLVEGQMDFLMAWQDGVKNLAATSGTALTGEHLKTLKRLADNLIVFFDSDNAGLIASERAIDLASASDFTVKIANLSLVPSAVGLKDPADLAQAKPGELIKIIGASQPAMRYYLRSYLNASENAATPVAKDFLSLKRNVRNVLTKIKNIASSVEQSFWIKELGELTNIPEANLLEELRTLAQSKTAHVGSANDGAPKENFDERHFSRRDLIAQRLIGLTLANAPYREKINAVADFFTEPYKLVADFLINKSGSALNLSDDLIKLADLINLRSSMELGDPAFLEAEFTALIKQLKGEYYREQQLAASSKIKSAEKSGDDQALDSALREHNKISQELDKISKGLYNV